MDQALEKHLASEVKVIPNAFKYTLHWRPGFLTDTNLWQLVNVPSFFCLDTTLIL